MNNNNPYDTSLEWMNFHDQQTEDIHQQEATHIYPLTPAYQREKIRPVSTPVKRLSKSEALERASYLKGFIMIATLLGFGTLGGLVANQMFSTSTSLKQTQVPAMQGPSMQAPSQQNPFPSDSSDSGGFFRRHGGGYGFGQGNNSGNNSGDNSGSNSGAFSGSHTS